MLADRRSLFLHVVHLVLLQPCMSAILRTGLLRTVPAIEVRIAVDGKFTETEMQSYLGISSYRTVLSVA